MDFLLSFLGTAVALIAAGAIAWKRRPKILDLLEKAVADRLDSVVMNTEFGKRITNIEDTIEDALTRPPDTKQQQQQRRK